MPSIRQILQRHDLPLRRRLYLIFYKYWYRVRRLQTPLKLRHSLRRLKHNHSRPWLALLRLFFPYPTWKFPIPEPLPPQKLLGNRELMILRRHDLRNLTAVPLWRARDTPLRSLYRMCECMLSGEYSPLGEETVYFWYQSRWELHDIPDPADPDPIRYALLASLVEELVAAFNWRLSLGLRRDRNHVFRERDGDPYPSYEPLSGPAWTRDVPPIPPECLASLPAEFVRNGCQLVLEAKGVSEHFAKRNIVTNVGWFYTI